MTDPGSGLEEACFACVYAPGHVMNDHCFIRAGDRWHCFHIWLLDDELNKTIGHAVSNDLAHWERCRDILPKEPPPSWESAHPGGNASYVIERNGVYHLFYSRYKQEGHRQTQQIGLATSGDLFTWHKHPGNPVFHPSPSWCPWEHRHDPDGPQPYRPECCRDPHVLHVDDQYVMYYVAMTCEPEICAVACCVSGDLVHWQDRGAVLTKPVSRDVGQGMMESPCVVQANGHWHLFYTHARGLYHAASDTPFRFEDPRFFCSAHASEVFEDGDGGWLISNVAKPPGLSHSRGVHVPELHLARVVFEGDQPVLQPFRAEPAG